MQAWMWQITVTVVLEGKHFPTYVLSGNIIFPVLFTEDRCNTTAWGIAVYSSPGQIIKTRKSNPPIVSMSRAQG